jgi:hypothetical protein
MQPDSKRYKDKFKYLAERDLIIAIESMVAEQVKAIDEAGDQAYIVSQKREIYNQYLEEVKAITDKATKGAYAESIKMSDDLYQGAVKLTKENITLLNAIKESGFQELATQVASDANTIWRQLASYSVTGNYKAIEENLLGKLDSLKVAKYGDTLVQTSIDTFYRETNAIRATAAGVKEFRYLGPGPERPFCNKIIGRTFTIDEISKLDNGQVGDVFTSCGGYNCRHYWSPVL